MYKGITIISGSEDTRKAILDQITEYIDENFTIKSFAIDTKLEEIPENYLIVLTSRTLEKELRDLGIEIDQEHLIIAERTIGYNLIEQLFMLPENSNVLFVNDVEETTNKSIEQLKKMGLDYINFIPFYPQMTGELKKVKIAITPGEVDKVPPFIETVYNIGSRILDFSTITKILTKLNMLDQKSGLFSQKYLKKIVNIGKKISEYSRNIEGLNQKFSEVLHGLASGFVILDSKGKISYINSECARILRIHKDQKNLIGKDFLGQIKNLALSEFINNSQESIVLKIFDKEFLIKKMRLHDNLLAFIFKDTLDSIEESNKLKSELIKKGFIAKYTFPDIAGESKEIQNAKQIATKLAKTDLTVLIEGESGTGKELFASAIHNNSLRKNGPFVAINFSALPDELTESELFGYEAGAFTGAKQEGKAGLLEMANGGTIFLDEIGEISLKVQAKILRVLQEKEILRIGGNEIRKIDVRIIAATNQNLQEMIQERKFRQDLFYRLRIGYLKLPKLAARGKDILYISKKILASKKKEETTFSPELKKILMDYSWPGNVRELDNLLSYMIAMSKDSLLDLNHLPDYNFFSSKIVENTDSLQNRSRGVKTPDDINQLILTAIAKLTEKGETAGRSSIAILLSQNNPSLNLTPNKIRSRLKKMEEKGLIQSNKGRGGSFLTEKGKVLLTEY